MRRLAHLLLNAATVTSLALLGAILLLSLLAPVGVRRPGGDGHPYLYVGLARWELTVTTSTHEPQIGERFAPSRGTHWPGLHLSSTQSMDRPNLTRQLHVAVPILILLTATLPACRLVTRAARRRRLTRRLATGLCPA